MSHWTPTQREALDQLLALTNGSNEQVLVGVLESCDWDVQRAAEVIFDAAPSGSHSAPAAPPPAPRRIEQFEVDDSLQAPSSSSGPVSRGRAAPGGGVGSIGGGMLSILAFPFNVLTGLLRFIFGILRIPFPQLRLFGGLNFYRPLAGGAARPAADARSVADRWVRALEEETGAVGSGRGRSSDEVMVSSSEAGTSGLTRRAAGGNGAAEGTKTLPDFMLTTYEEFLETCQKETRIGCVVLVSDEHDDDADFKRGTLTDPAFVKLLTDNKFAIWGGDIRDREAWSASQKLQATTYPFVAFIALQQRRGASSRNNTAPSLTILSRHQGKSMPSPSAPTSAGALIIHLERQLLPRVLPFLDGLKAAQRDRERERALRAEQDRAFEAAARTDRERIERRRTEEREAAAAQARTEQAAREEAEQRARAASDRHARDSQRLAWRRYARRALVPPEPAPGAGGPAGREKGAVRVAVRLPDGARVVRTFGGAADLTALYAFVDTQFVPAVLLPPGDPDAPPAGIAPGEAGVEEQVHAFGGAERWWRFRLVSAFPRREVKWEPRTRLASVEGLRGGGQLVVEMVEGEDARAPAPSNGHGGEDEDDGYHTEESE